MYEAFMVFCWPLVKRYIDAYNDLIEAERIVKAKEKANLLAKAKRLEVQTVEVEDCGVLTWHVHNNRQRGENRVSTELIIKAASSEE